MPDLLFVEVRGRINKINRAANRAITPPNLFGMDRRMAYTQRKYHSGLMWIGVTSGFASRKFSGSVNRFGENKTININSDRAMI
jgi:hypothetical protein